MPAHTIAGEACEAGQRTKYQTLAGEMFATATINSVGASSDDGEYSNVNVTWTPPGESPQTGDHVYWKELGWVKGDPSGPPWPG